MGRMRRHPGFQDKTSYSQRTELSCGTVEVNPAVAVTFMRQLCSSRIDDETRQMTLFGRGEAGDER